MKNQEELIGKKVYGFEFNEKRISYSEFMNNYIGRIGEITEYDNDYDVFKVDFNDDWFLYPADQIEAHLVEEEIPNLSDGVMMLVSFNNIDWFERKVLGKKNNSFYCWNEEYKNLIQVWDYAKEIIIEPTKEEQLKAILGSSDKVSEIMELFKN